MNELAKIFIYNETPIRVVEKDGEPWWVAKDVCDVLGYTNSRKAIKDHVDDEDKKEGVTIRYGIPGNPNFTLINEAGLYSLIFSSKLPAARHFKRWVTHEVLPSIRKTGSYSVNGDMKQARYLLELIDKCQHEQQKTVLISMAANIATGQKVFPIPSYAEIPHKFSDFGLDEYLQSHYVIDRPPGDVYKEYKKFCEENRIQAVPSKGTFTHFVNKKLDTCIVRKKIGNRKVPVFGD